MSRRKKLTRKDKEKLTKQNKCWKCGNIIQVHKTGYECTNCGNIYQKYV